jgi:hypothetical protein
MKVEILKSDEGVQIHLENEDGSKTVWLCDTEQAAIFKLANLLFSAQEDPKQAKRSILIGDFDAPEPKEKPLAERAEKIREDLKKSGLAQKGGDMAAKDLEKFKDILKKMQEAQEISAPFTVPSIYDTPGIKIYPASIPQPIPMMPYIGDLPYSVSGTGQPWWVQSQNIQVTNFSGAALVETPAADVLTANGSAVKMFNVSMSLQSNG